MKQTADGVPASDAPAPRESARLRAARRLARAAATFPDIELAPSADASGDADAHEERESALADAIEYAARSRWLTLQRIIEHVIDRPWDRLEPKLQAVLLSGAAQLLLMDRLPAHAVIDESVSIGRSLVRHRAAGMVNAVLRRIAELRKEDIDAPGREWDRDVLPLGDGRGRKLAAPVFSAGRIERCAEQTSHPLSLLTLLINADGHEMAMNIAAHGITRAPIIVTGSDPDASEFLVPHEQPGFHVLTGGTSVLRALFRTQPTMRVQDPSSARPIELTSEVQPGVIVDACAGRGTKTRQLRRCHPRAEIVAFDINPARRAVLREVFAGDDAVTVAEPKDLARYRGAADLLVLDLPCSNTGVLPRRPEAKYRAHPRVLESVARLQQQIVADTYALRAERGSLLIATCSVLRYENEDLTTGTARMHHLRVTRSERLQPAGLPGDPPTRYRDGGFGALLQPS